MSEIRIRSRISVIRTRSRVVAGVDRWGDRSKTKWYFHSHDKEISGLELHDCFYSDTKEGATVLFNSMHPNQEILSIEL